MVGDVFGIKHLGDPKPGCISFDRDDHNTAQVVLSHSDYSLSERKLKIKARNTRYKQDSTAKISLRMTTLTITGKRQTETIRERKVRVRISNQIKPTGPSRTLSDVNQS